MRCWRCMRAGCDRGWCCAALTAASREGGRPAVRGACRRPQACAPWGCKRACLTTAFGDAQGVGSLCGDYRRLGSPPPGRAWKGVANALEVRKTPRREPPTRAERRALPLAATSPSLDAAVSAAEHCTRGADDASAIQRRHPLALLTQCAQRRPVEALEGLEGHATVLVAPRPRDRAVDEEGRSPTAACGRGTRGRESARAGCSRAGRGRAGSRPRSRAAGRAPASRGPAAARAGRSTSSSPSSDAKRRRRRRSRAGATTAARHAGPVGDLGRRGGAEAPEVAPHRVVDGVGVVDRPAVRASARPGRRGPRDGAPRCPTAGRARCAASG